MKVKIVTVLQGMVMGIAEIIPGVSGSTLALVMGIYDNFIEFLSEVSDFLKGIIKFILRKESFSNLKERFKKINLRFGIFLLLGMVISLALFSNIITVLLEEYPQYVFSFFFGLVIASISIPWSEMKTRSIKQLLIVAITFIVFFIILGLKPATVVDPSPLFLFFAGAAAICAMVLPGVSGSFIFLLLGVYDYVISLLRDLTKLSIDSTKIIAITAVALGIVVGFSIFVKFLKAGLKKYPSEIMAFLVGIMFASLRVLWPFMTVSGPVHEDAISTLPKVLPWEVPTEQMVLSVVLILIAAGLVKLLHKFSAGSNLSDLK